jgi:GTP cyclohydrolase I
MSLEQNYTEILSQLGEDVSREGLLDTPKRPQSHAVPLPRL